MTFDERLQVLLIGAFISLCVSVLTNIFFYYLGRHREIADIDKQIKAIIPLIEPAIVNGDPESIRPTMENMLGRYGLFQKNTKVKRSFDEIHTIYVFLKNEGYKHNPERKQRDLELIWEIQQRFG